MKMFRKQFLVGFAIGLSVLILLSGSHNAVGANSPPPSGKYWCVFEHLSKDSGYLSGVNAKEVQIDVFSGSPLVRSLKLSDANALFSVRDGYINLEVESESIPGVIASATMETATPRMKVELKTSKGKTPGIHSLICEKREPDGPMRLP